MEILPSIDLRGGKVVRLTQGDYDRQTTYRDDAVQVAREFEAAAVHWIHVVDLDAARSGRPVNMGVVQAIRSAVSVKIQLGGGARDEAAIDAMLAGGVDRVVVGSAALKDWAWFERLAARDDLAGRIALGLDARGGRLAVAGWTEQVRETALEMAARVKGWTIGAIVYTDISRDGMLSGINLDATSRMIAATDVPVIASGGVQSLEDVAGCKRIGCAGMIVGRAYYEGRIDLVEACREAAV
jgi:phosphoribosylformimino-5-aminoimidazole carboxamide ribotide isomerase